MSVPAPTAELDTRFSSPNATARPWSDVVDALERAEIFWLSTVRRDGRPHVTPLPAMWLDGSLYFCTGPEEQKAKNIEANPHCVLTTGNDRYRSGLDVVVEGSAVRTTDDSLLRRLAAIWASKLDWAFDVSDGAFHDGSTETGSTETGSTETGSTETGSTETGGTAYVYAVAPTKVLAFGKGEPFSQTRYRFS